MTMRSKQWYTKTSVPPNSLMNSSKATPVRRSVKRKTIPRGSSKRIVRDKDFRLAGKVRYIQSRAANRDGRIVTIGPLVLFSTETGDAWLLDPADRLALPLGRAGDPQPVH